MIGAPEVLYLAGQIDHWLKGKKISLVVPQYTPHKFTFYSNDPDSFTERLTGGFLEATHARGGMVEIKAGNSLLIFTDGVNLRFYGPGEKLPTKYQFLLGFEDESCLIASVRMYGGIFCIPEDWEMGFYRIYYIMLVSIPKKG